MIWNSRRGWIGVDLGARAVKLVQVEQRDGMLQVEQALVIQRRSAWVGDSIGDAAPLPSSEEIRAALSLPPGFRGKQAACILPMSVYDTRCLTISKGNESEQREEIAEQLAADYGELDGSREFDFVSGETAHEAGSDTENVTVSSLSEAWAMQVAKDFSQAGLAVRVLDGTPLAMARAIQLAGAAYSREPVIAIDWGYSRSTLCLVAKGHPIFVRCLRDSAFANLVEAMEKQLGVSADEASKLLADHGLGDRSTATRDELQRVIDEVTAPALAAFTDEVNRTIAYLTSHRRQHLPTHLVLMGAGATIKNVSGFLEGKVDMPVTTWRPENIRLQPSPTSAVPLELLAPAIALSTLAWK